MAHRIAANKQEIDLLSPLLFWADFAELKIRLKDFNNKPIISKHASIDADYLPGDIGGIIGT